MNEQQADQVIRDLALIIQKLEASSAGDASAANQVIGNASLSSIDTKVGTSNTSLTTLINNETSKIRRIQGAANYSRVIVGNVTTPANPVTITHTGTTLIGAETIIETITYTDPAAVSPVVVSIVYS